MSGVAPRRAQPEVEPHLVIKIPQCWKALAYFPDGRKLVASCGKKGVTMWNANNGMEEVISMVNRRHRWGSDGVFDFAVTRDGKKIICRTSMNKIKVWDVGLKDIVKEWTHPTYFPRLAISPDDLFVAVYSGSTIYIHAIEGWEVKQVIEVGKSIYQVSFSPAGNKLACATDRDDGIFVYDVATGTLLLGPLTARPSWINCVIWSHDGSRLFSSSGCDIRSWNANTGEQIGHPWTGHTFVVRSLSLSPDGSTLASASWDQTVRFWNANSGDSLGQPLRHERSVKIVCFSPSGEFVASASGYEQQLYVWRAPQSNNFGSRINSTLLGMDSTYRTQALPPPYSTHVSGSEQPLDFGFDVHGPSHSAMTDLSSASLPTPYALHQNIASDSSGNTPDDHNLNSIVGNPSVEPAEHQKMFELHLRRLVELGTSGGLLVTPIFLRSLLPPETQNASLTSSEYVADANSMHVASSGESTSTFRATPNDDARKICKIDRIRQKLMDMLHEIGFSLPKGRLPWFTLEGDLEKKGYRMINWPEGVVRYRDKGISGLSVEDADKLLDALSRDERQLGFIRLSEDLNNGSSSSADGLGENRPCTSGVAAMQTATRQPRFRTVVTAETFLQRPNKRRRV